MSAETEAIGQKLRASQNDYLNRLLGLKKFPDTGRVAGSAGETADSYLGAPARQAVSELQDGNVNLDALRRVWGRVGQDPKNAPTGVDIASKATTNPYLGAALATATDVGAQVPVGLIGKATGLIPGVSGILKGVKEAGNVADASELFKARGEAPTSPDVKIAKAYGQTGDVLDANDTLLGRAEQDRQNARYEKGDMSQKQYQEKVPSAYDNPKNAPPKPMEPIEKRPEDYAREEFEKPDEKPSAMETANQRWNPTSEELQAKENKNTLSDQSDNEDWNHFVRNLDDDKKDLVQNILNRYPSDETAKSLLAASNAPSHAPYVTQELTGFDKHPLPNLEAKPTGQIGTPGISQPYTKDGLSYQEAFPWMDSKFGAAKQLLQRHNSIDMPAQIHTSSDLIGRQDYIDQIPKGSTVNMYKMTNDDTLNRILFPGNASNKRLDSAVDKLREAGIKTNVVNPTIEEITDAAGGKQRLFKQTGIAPANQEQRFRDLGHISDEEMANKGPKLVRSPDDRED